MVTPDTFSQASVYDLLSAAAHGKAGMDHRWLRAIIDRGEGAVADLVRFGLEDRSDDPIPLDEDLVLILHHLRTPAAVPYYVEFLRRNPAEAPDSLANALYPVREAALEPLLSLYEDLEEDEAGDVAFLLASFRIPDERVRRILVDRLEYDAEDGAIALGLYGDPETRPALERMLAEVGEDAHLKTIVEDAIAELGRPLEEYVHELDIFDEFPEKAAPDTSVLEDADLLDMLESADAEYRFTAAGGFINRELNDDVVARLLERARGDADAKVRAKCWEALGALSASNDEVYEAMLGRLRDTNASMIERAGALVGLGQRADEDPIRPFAEEFYRNPATRAAALSAMWNSLDKSYAKYFPEHLDDPDPEVRKQAISGVGYLEIQSAAEKLRSLFEDEDLRPNALFAYALSARTEVSPARVRSLLRRIEKLAKGLSEEEQELVQVALDERLMLKGHKPVFHAAAHRHDHGSDA
jgi:HEAT repeat protein